MSDAINDLLGFWFGDMQDRDGEIAERQAGLWWQPSADQDAELKSRFGDLARQAVAGECDDWVGTAHGRLALVILLDQLPRVLYRDRPEAYAQDHSALAHSLQAEGQGQDRELRPIERVFLYMPMQHAESLMVQDESVRRFEGLAAQVDEADRPAFETFATFARRHREVVLRFDRFPHRNAILGRTSTPAEQAFLDSGEGPF